MTHVLRSLPPGAAPFLALFFVVALAGRTEAQWAGGALDVPPGARQAGLGGAGVALIGNAAEAMGWNPAGLAWAERGGAQLTRVDLMPDFEPVLHHHGAAAAPLGPVGIGASFSHVRYEFGFIDDTAQGLPDYDEMAAAIGLGVRLHRTLSIGGSLKWVRGEYYDSERAEALAGDLGLLWQSRWRALRYGAGFAWQNFGEALEFPGEDGVPLARNYKAGAMAEVTRALTHHFTLGALAVFDFNQSALHTKDRSRNGGLEGWIAWQDQVRLAGRVGYAHEALQDIRDFSGGGGIRIRELSFDAGWLPPPRDSGMDGVFKFTIGIQIPRPSGPG